MRRDLSHLDPAERRRWEALGRRLRALRHASGLTQAQVAREVGAHRPAVTLIENGRLRVDALRLLDLARLYGTTPDAVFGLDLDAGDGDGR